MKAREMRRVRGTEQGEVETSEHAVQSTKEGVLVHTFGGWSWYSVQLVCTPYEGRGFRWHLPLLTVLLTVERAGGE